MANSMTVLVQCKQLHEFQVAGKCMGMHDLRVNGIHSLYDLEMELPILYMYNI